MVNDRISKSRIIMTAMDELFKKIDLIEQGKLGKDQFGQVTSNYMKQEAIENPAFKKPAVKSSIIKKGGLISLTKTGKGRLYAIIIIIALVVIYFEGKLFRKVTGL